jgi:hypothetical protein
MKYICLGHFDKGKREGMTESEQDAMFDTCFEYDDHLRARRALEWWRSASASGNRLDPVLEERQSRNDGRSLCGDQGTTRRHSHLICQQQLVRILPI